MPARLVGKDCFGLLSLDQAAEALAQAVCVFFDDGIVRHSFDGSVGSAEGHGKSHGLLKSLVEFRLEFGQFPIHGWTLRLWAWFARLPRRSHVTKEFGILPLTFFESCRCRQKLTCTLGSVASLLALASRRGLPENDDFAGLS